MSRIANTIGERAYNHGYAFATAKYKKNRTEIGNQFDEMMAIVTELMFSGCLSDDERDYISDQYQKGLDDGNNA